MTATRKAEALRPVKLLLVEPLTAEGALSGRREMIALDPGHGAGIGDTVVVAREGAVVAQIMGRADVPANTVIVGVVDDWARG